MSNNITNTKIIHLNNLPKRNGRSKQIDWVQSIGYTVEFIYKDINGFLKILNYNPKTRKLLIQYNNITFDIMISNFSSCKIGRKINYTREIKKYKSNPKNEGIKLPSKKQIKSFYLYNVNDIIRTKTGEIKILKQTRLGSRNELAYYYECLKDGYKGYICQSVLITGRGCNVCAGNKCIVGYTDMWTTNPELAKMLANPEDGHKYTQSSGKKVDWVCKDCGGIVKEKSISLVKNHGLSCHNCSDGLSYPEKFMISLLNQLHIDYITHNSFKWSQNKEYDFYIPYLNCIIETHGMQHYKNKFKKGSRTLEEEQSNDKLKRLLAYKNNISIYIEIDCRKSDITWIKNNIINSQLGSHIDLKNVDWNKCDYDATSSTIIKLSELWNQNKSIEELMEICKLSKCIVTKYLRKGNSLGLCSYDWHKLLGKQAMKTVKCLNDNLIFESIVKASKYYNISVSSISACCNGRQKFTYNEYRTEKLYFTFL